MNSFNICPKCNGKGYVFVVGEPHEDINKVTCDNCDGQGDMFMVK